MCECVHEWLQVAVDQSFSKINALNVMRMARRSLERWRGGRPAGWAGDRPTVGGGTEGSHLGVELIHDEVAQRGFEEVLLGAVLEQGVVHGV